MKETKQSSQYKSIDKTKVQAADLTTPGKIGTSKVMPVTSNGKASDGELLDEANNTVNAGMMGSGLAGSSSRPAPGKPALKKKMTTTEATKWRSKQDRMNLYIMEKNLGLTGIDAIRQKELVRWKENDIKGNRKTLYIKEVQKRNDVILMVADQTRLEQLQNSEDRWPCLNQRKQLQKIRIYINMFAWNIVKHNIFETVSITVILLNSITLAAETPGEEPTPFIKLTDDIFLVLYTIELVIKVLAYGFIFNKGAYLRESWNILDFIIVASAYFSLATASSPDPATGETEEGFSLSGLRAFRVLRPLKTITTIRGLRVLVSSVLKAIPLLKHAILLICFFFLIFAIGGTQIFMGMLKQRCVNIETGQLLPEEPNLCGGVSTCPEGYYCGKQNENPFFGSVDFDDIFSSLLMVFVCITLEGWSEIQKLYQMTFTDAVFLYFIPLVFIGAFFLLNLTLAVINTSFSKAQEESNKEQADAKAKAGEAKKSSDQVVMEALESDSKEIGIHQFFIAKRAAKKMIEYLRDMQKKEAAQKEREKEMLANGEVITTSALADYKNQVQIEIAQDQKIGDVIAPQNVSMAASSAISSPMKSRNANQQSEMGSNVKTIKEEDEPDEDHEKHSAHVAQFLAQLNRTDGGQDSPRDKGQRPALAPNLSLKKNGNNGKPNDLQINKLSSVHSTDKKPAIAGITKISDRGGYQGILTDESKMKEEFGIDMVVPAAHKQTPLKKKGEEDAESGEHPFDLSFIESLQDYPNYMSDEERPARLHKSYDGASSLESDSSFGARIDDLKQTAVANRTKRTPGVDLMPSKGVNKTFLRYPTTDFRNKDPMNDTVQSTMYGGKNESASYSIVEMGKSKAGANMAKSAAGGAKQQDNLKQATPGDDNKSMVSFSVAKHQTKKNLKKIYNEVDEDFLMTVKPKDPFEFVDKRTQKIEINPGIHYRSTSHEEVFEMRTALAEATAMSKNNVFISPPPDFQEGDDDDYVPDDYLKPMHDPYQLKTRYAIKEVEEVHFDSDDEDNLILASQPYDTIQNIGFKDQLTQLPTKFISRRSDIIVSSTLSITLTPQDDGYVIKNQIELTDEERIAWVDKRQEFRALDIVTCSIPQPGFYTCNYSPENSSQSGGRSSVGFKGVGDTPEPSIQQQSQKYGALMNDAASQNSAGANNQSSYDHKLGASASVLSIKPKIPGSLLSAPLMPHQMVGMTAEEKRLYNLQKGKYESAVRQYKKNPNKPENKVWTLEDAKKLVNGKYHEEEEEDDLNVGSAPNNAKGDDVDMASTMLISGDLKGANNRLKEFEEAALNILVTNQASGINTEKLGILNKGNEINKELKEEFNLPDDMESNTINYTEVRKRDCSVKRKTPIWSGQDVLEINLNPSQSNWIANESLNKVRVWPKGGFRYLKRARWVLKRFVKLSIFDHFMTFAVLVNTVVMAMDRYGIGKEEEAVLNTFNDVFTWLFIAEMSLKLLAIGVKKYVGDTMNILDGTVVLLSIVELIAMAGADADTASPLSAVKVFRTFRVVRVVRLLRKLQQMQVIVGVIARSFSSFMYIAILMFVLMFIFALLGMQFFGGNFNFDEEKPRGNYDSFNIALITVFQVLTMENWQTVLFDTLRIGGSKFFPALYYVTWIFIGNFILLNLFLAILLDSFLVEEEEFGSSEEQEAAEAAAREAKMKLMLKEKERRMKKMGTSMFKGKNEIKQWRMQETAKANFAHMVTGKKKDELLVDDVDDLDETAVRDIFTDDLKITKNKEKAKKKRESFEGVECSRSLYILRKKSCLRKYCYMIKESKIFENTILALIVLSSIKLAVDTYLVDFDKDSTTMVVADGIDTFFTFAFLLECIIKVIALGFIMDRGSYIRETWNQLDFFIVVSSMVDFFLTGVDIPAVKILRLLRTLRPLRFLSHNKAMRLIVVALLDSVGSIFNVMIVVMVVWLMFAIFGVNMFAGKFQYCSINQFQYHDKYTCNVNGGSWELYDSNFDNVANAMMTLFIVASLEGWPDIMIQAVDSTGVDKGPTQEASPLNAYFFMLFILIGSFFFLNFFIGVLFVKYTDAQNQEVKGFKQVHLNWIDIQRMILKAKVDHSLANKPDSPYKLKFWKLVESKGFEYTILTFIILNMIQMACYGDNSTKSFESLLDFTNYIFNLVFIVEAVFKIIAYGWSYFDTAWNRFDFFIVLSSIFDMSLELVDLEASPFLRDLPSIIRILRVLRVSRVLRLATKSRGLLALVQTITMSIQSLLNVFGLLMLIFFMLSILGNFFFSGITTGVAMDDFKNFQNFGQAFLLLFAISTGEDWNRIMYDCIDTPPDCIEGETCGTSLTPVYYIIFQMLCSQVMLNLFILVIIQQFETYYVSEDNPLEQFRENSERFNKTWEKFTGKYKCQKIKEKQLLAFFTHLDPPIGLPEGTSEDGIRKVMLKMGIRTDDGFVYYNELLYRCMRRQYGSFKLNKTMAIIELRTQYELYLRTLKAQKAKRQEVAKESEQFFGKMLGTGKAVNPFLTMMYFRISFTLWLNHTKKEEKKKLHFSKQEKKRIEADRLGRDYDYEPLPVENTQFCYVTIEVEEEVLYTSEEEDEDVSASGSLPGRIRGTDGSNSDRGSPSPGPGGMSRNKAGGRNMGKSGIRRSRAGLSNTPGGRKGSIQGHQTDTEFNKGGSLIAGADEGSIGRHSKNSFGMRPNATTVRDANYTDQKGVRGSISKL